MELKTKVFIDSSVQTYEDFFLDILEGVQKLIPGYADYYFLFSTASKSDELYSFLRDTKLSDPIASRLVGDLESATISFSFGWEEQEYVFIILTDDDMHLLDNPPALIGLIIHEVIHGLERQRGLENDLRRSLELNQELYTNLARLIPKYSEDKLVQMFEEIGMMALYVLKDIFVNREAIERGFGAEVLESYRSLFFLDQPPENQLPKIPFKLSKDEVTNVYDLAQFTQTFNILLSLVPSWLPFLKATSAYEKQQAFEIRDFIDETYSHVALLSQYFEPIENVYLVEFGFNIQFHQKWFSHVFSTAINFLTNGQFQLWQLENLVNDVEPLVEEEKESGSEEEELVTHRILVTILKVAYIQAKATDVPSDKIEGIREKLRMNIPQDELEEWEETYEEYDREILLLFSLSLAVPLLREKFLEEIHNLRRYTRVTLGIMQVLKDLDPPEERLELYEEFRDDLCQFITERDTRYLSLRILFPLEARITSLIFPDDLSLTADESEEFLALGRFLGLPKLNWILNLAHKLARMVKTNMAKAQEDGEELPSPELLAMTSAIVVGDLSKDQEHLIIPLFRAVLMAINLPMPLIKATVLLFGNAFSNDSDE